MKIDNVQTKQILFADLSDTAVGLGARDRLGRVGHAQQI